MIFLTTPRFARTFLALTKSFARRAGKTSTGPAALDRHKLAVGDYRFALDSFDEK
ncbi:MAG TPA: hypothetical protein VGJ79_08670 [Candidatus Dormibacteraeota bacterium]